MNISILQSNINYSKSIEDEWSKHLPFESFGYSIPTARFSSAEIKYNGKLSNIEKHIWPINILLNLRVLTNFKIYTLEA